MLLIATRHCCRRLALARYAEADDSLDGVVIGVLIFMGAVVFGARAFLRKDS